MTIRKLRLGSVTTLAVLLLLPVSTSAYIWGDNITYHRPKEWTPDNVCDTIPLVGDNDGRGPEKTCAYVKNAPRRDRPQDGTPLGINGGEYITTWEPGSGGPKTSRC
ncbi:uncharacterized protein AB675_3663 [Cyphellophora attinorum]|uniref:Uncharacterized protein n=1 Tax=Cyphellophora attinorum TaxID=1664694 RepID=A0A0N1NYG5_9EURO|nr:uncharacterized protein AB675_3663 [Phialophora attinorum]KPI37125.1 hypothetical protein AB675_3663 [Phialophora attinorum]